MDSGDPLGTKVFMGAQKLPLKIVAAQPYVKVTASSWVTAAAQLGAAKSRMSI